MKNTDPTFLEKTIYSHLETYLKHFFFTKSTLVAILKHCSQAKTFTQAKTFRNNNICIVSQFVGKQNNFIYCS